jgi:hypothetical protein
MISKRRHELNRMMSEAKRSYTLITEGAGMGFGKKSDEEKAQAAAPSTPALCVAAVIAAHSEG